MENTEIFKQSVVDETASFIAGELKTMLDRRNIDSPLSRWLDACPAYDKLRIGEQVLATLKALNLAALDVIADMASLTHDTPDDDDEEADVADLEKHLRASAFEEEARPAT